MRVIYHPDAAAELIESAQFYESRLPGLGLDFLDEIERAVALIAKSPERYVLARGNIRRFSFSLITYLDVIDINRIVEFSIHIYQYIQGRNMCGINSHTVPLVPSVRIIHIIDIINVITNYFEPRIVTIR